MVRFSHNSSRAGGMEMQLWKKHRCCSGWPAISGRRFGHDVLTTADSGVAGPGVGRSGLPIGTVWVFFQSQEFEQ